MKFMNVFEENIIVPDGCHVETFELKPNDVIVLNMPTDMDGTIVYDVETVETIYDMFTKQFINNKTVCLVDNIKLSVRTREEIIEWLKS